MLEIFKTVFLLSVMGTVVILALLVLKPITAKKFWHELTHFKHGDLTFKWLTLLVNAVHWFNPFAYLLSANVNETYEVSCDMTVIRDMDEQGRQLYMKPILDSGQRKEEGTICLKGFILPG